MKKEYLKIRWFDCPKCKKKNSWQVVVSGTTDRKGKERLYTEIIIAHQCSNCSYRSNYTFQK